VAKVERDPERGFVVWMEGLPGAGKTTLAKSLARALESEGRRVEVLDGEEVRRQFFPELGFSRKDREVHARRVSLLARMLANHGAVVFVAMITPYETSRQAARAAVPERFTEVWLRCPVETCARRDPRGLYRMTSQGQFSRLTGVDDPFEEPLNPDLVVDTGRDSVEECTHRVLDHLTRVGVRSVIAA
jgi:adenylyl-sulfate kinase